MTKETYGNSLQVAICKQFGIDHALDSNRYCPEVITAIKAQKLVQKLFKDLPKPKTFLTRSRQFTLEQIKTCPHTFLLENGETLSAKTFTTSNRFAPKVVGQAGDEVFNYIFGHLSETRISRENYKKFIIKNVVDIVPILLDYALISDWNIFVFFTNANYEYKIIKRGSIPEQTFDSTDFSFTRAGAKQWNESNTLKYKGESLAEFQMHQNRSGYKIRLIFSAFEKLVVNQPTVKKNNATLGASAERAIAEKFNLLNSAQLDKTFPNADAAITSKLKDHYSTEEKRLFANKPVSYQGSQARARGAASKSGVDFELENQLTLSVKTNANKSYKVCPPEIGQPSPKTFDLYFGAKDWYSPPMNEIKFRDLVSDNTKVCFLLKEYVDYLNECDFILWTAYLEKKKTLEIISELIAKNKLSKIKFDANKIKNNKFDKTRSSISIAYGESPITLGEFQVHGGRNSLKFRFNLTNLLRIAAEQNL